MMTWSVATHQGAWAVGVWCLPGPAGVSSLMCVAAQKQCWAITWAAASMHGSQRVTCLQFSRLKEKSRHRGCCYGHCTLRSSRRSQMWCACEPDVNACAPASTLTLDPNTFAFKRIRLRARLCIVIARPCMPCLRGLSQPQCAGPGRVVRSAAPPHHQSLST